VGIRVPGRRCSFYSVIIMKKSAFTLIELLVVIAIIAILAAILFPVFAQAKAAAKKTMCLSNTKQTSTGLQMYMGDFEDVFPVWTANACGTQPVINGGGSFDTGYMYNALIQPYIKNGIDPKTGKLDGVWECPSIKSQLSGISNTFAYNYYGLGGTSNCVGTPLGAQYAPFNDGQYAYAARASSVAKMAETYVFADGAQLMRPPAYIDANGTAAVNNVGVWGSHQPGTAVISPSNVSSALYGPGTFRGTWVTGRKTNVTFGDSHSKTVNTMSMVSNKVVMENGSWRGSLPGGGTDAGNAGWTRGDY
jgi:prepilin-type N-terminal cleavage/methylation domain-containing protein